MTTPRITQERHKMLVWSHRKSTSEHGDYCGYCRAVWPCDVELLLSALTAARAMAEALEQAMSNMPQGPAYGNRYRQARAALAAFREKVEG